MRACVVIAIVVFIGAIVPIGASFGQDLARFVTLPTPDGPLDAYRDSGYSSESHEHYVSWSTPYREIHCQEDYATTFFMAIDRRYPASGTPKTYLRISYTATDYPLLTGRADMYFDVDALRPHALIAGSGPRGIAFSTHGRPQKIHNRMWFLLPDSLALPAAIAESVYVKVYAGHGNCTVMLDAQDIALLRYWARLVTGQTPSKGRRVKLSYGVPNHEVPANRPLQPPGLRVTAPAEQARSALARG